jgi:nanoRNase/pAp phosphatase (c-di-AMP/oligoRNAs hydrolase)
MKPKQLFDELTEVAKALGFAIRKDTGNFRSNNCVLKEEKIIILNKFGSIESHNRTIALAINQSDNNSIFIKPVIREYLAEEMQKPLVGALEEINNQKKD